VDILVVYDIAGWQFKTSLKTSLPIWTHFMNLPTRSRMMTISRSVTTYTTLPTLASLLVTKGKRRERRSTIRKESNTLSEVHHSRITNPERRTQLVSKTRRRSSKAFLKHSGKSTGKHQSV
jgi:hypothetical protein